MPENPYPALITAARRGSAFRTALLAMAIFTALAALANCTTGPGNLCSDCPTATIEPEAAEWTPELVKQEIARQLFERSRETVHEFGLNVEGGEEFVISGRDRVAPPPDTTGWRVEQDNDGLWLVETSELLYLFTEESKTFTIVLHLQD